MSYIRCLSNPEGLYIWHDTSGYIVVSYRAGMFACAVEDFNYLLEQWDKNGTFASRPTCSVKETKKFKVQLTLRGHDGQKPPKRITMWLVTWAYICRHLPRKRRGQ